MSHISNTLANVRSRKYTKAAHVVFCVAFALWGAGLAHAAPPPIVLVPVVTDPADEPRILALARTLQSALAAQQLPTVAARYSAALEAAKTGGDSFAAALELTGDFPLLRYEHYSDELAREHARRLAELAGAPHALLVAAPIANRFLVRRISRGEGESITLSDPYEPTLVDHALAQLVPGQAPTAPSAPRLPPADDAGPRRWAPQWATAAAGAVALGGLVATVRLAAKRVRLAERFQNTPVEDPAYLSRGEAWRAGRAPLLASAGIASAAASTATTLFALHSKRTTLLWFSAPSAALGTGLIAWAAADLARAAPCSGAALDAACVASETRQDRGILLALTAAPLLSLAATHLGRWGHHRLQLAATASSHTLGISLAVLNNH